MRTLALILLLIPSLSQADAVSKLRETTVHIAIGSGSIVEGPSGRVYMLSNWHVCNSGSWAGKMRANFEGGELVEGKIVKKDAISDLCATRILKKRPALRVATTLVPRQQLYTRGYPYGVLSETTGQYTGKNTWTYTYPIDVVGECPPGSRKLRDGMGHIVGCNIDYLDNLTNMYSRPGSSGSPVVDINGDLVGVISSWDEKHDAGGMVPIEALQEFMKDL